MLLTQHDHTQPTDCIATSATRQKTFDAVKSLLAGISDPYHATHSQSLDIVLKWRAYLEVLLYN